MILKNTEKTAVNIIMKTLQEGEVLTHTYSGTFQTKNGKVYLMYNDGYEGCALTSDGKIVRLNRYKSGSAMVFEKDAEHITSYATPLGNLPMCIRTLSLSENLNEKGSLDIEYNISIGESEPVKNIINVKIEEIKNVDK